jgi:cystathionine beta-synthase
MTAAARGYRMIITMPEKMSQEKQDALMGLGATIIRTPTSYAFDHANSHVGIAFRLEEELKNAHVLDQYKNPSNPMAHYEETGQEIWDQCEGKIDYVFMGSGTGGTLTGISRKLKEKNPDIKIIAIDPAGSILAQPESINGPGPELGQQTEGVGYDFIPRVIDRTCTDEWMKADDHPSFIMARRLLREEGLMCGGSSGSAMYCALDYIKKHNIGKGKRVVVILPDNIRNYMSKHLSMDWMYERGYVTEQECASSYVSDLVPNTDWGQDKTVSSLDLPEAVFIPETTLIIELLAKFTEHGFAQFPVKRESDGKIMGFVTKSDLMLKLVKQRV